MLHKYRSGFVAIVGKPNVGKSTILNGLLSKKISIVSEKPETTIDNIQGILTTDSAQAVFVDTPGIHRPYLLLGKRMVKKAKSSLYEADIILFVAEVTSGLCQEDILIIDLVNEVKKPAIALINKIDLRSKANILPLTEEINKRYSFLDIIPISALKGDNMQLLKEKALESLPEGERHYPDGQFTNKDEEFQTSEIIREKALLLTRQEVPHSIAVVIENLMPRQEKEILDIEATIYVERESQKGIIIGQKGEMIKEISTLSRQELETVFNKKVFLRVWVKVLKNWRKDIESLKLLGMD